MKSQSFQVIIVFKSFQPPEGSFASILESLGSFVFLTYAKKMVEIETESCVQGKPTDSQYLPISVLLPPFYTFEATCMIQKASNIPIDTAGLAWMEPTIIENRRRRGTGRRPGQGSSQLWVLSTARNVLRRLQELPSQSSPPTHPQWVVIVGPSSSGQKMWFGVVLLIHYRSKGCPTLSWLSPDQQVSKHLALFYS